MGNCGHHSAHSLLQPQPGEDKGILPEGSCDAVFLSRLAPVGAVQHTPQGRAPLCEDGDLQVIACIRAATIMMPQLPE